MKIYWQTATNTILTETSFLTRMEDASQTILDWAAGTLFLSGELLESFVSDKLDVLKQSYLEVSLPYSTFSECESHVTAFYQAHEAVIQAFVYDRWTWIKQVETFTYTDYDYANVSINNNLLDHVLIDEPVVH